MDSSNKYNDLEWAIGLHRSVLNMIGLWPQQNKDQHDEFFSKFRMLFNTTLIIFVLIIPALAQLIKIWGDMIQIIDNLQFTLPFLLSILKIFIMWYKKKVLSLLINIIIKDWMRVKMNKERNVMLRNARITRILIKGGIFVAIFAAFIRMSPTFFKQYFGHVKNLTNLEKSLPIPTHYWYDISNSPIYELTYLAQTISVFTCALTYVVIDNFLGLLILHVCGQMESLHLRLLNLGKDPDFRAVLKYNVKDHIRLIRFVEAIDDTFNLLLLGIIGFSCILISLLGFLMVNAINQDSHLSIPKITWYFSAIASMLLQSGLYCTVGELLVNQSEKIHRTTYECIWYTLNLKTAKDLTLIMLCAKRQLNITAGKIFPMTMTTFCSILKTSMGYISMLLAVRN
ncbi:odorant receptor 43a-like isoform X2 [Solenopsis invicta]|uniref:odorant receptor 43a-like isoform X2 n=1 Tax=Solenopsis invicta TaxID=13686 RepID=UPI00193DC36D|nr:odorant receptor 43a-like isoform X2 [Solenopsis invicta]